MEEKKTLKTGSGGEEQPTVHADQSPFVRTPAAGADRPTPRPGQAGWQAPLPATPVQPPFTPGAGFPQPEAATQLIGQRPTPVFAWLVVLDGADRGRIHTLQPGTTTLGRLQGNNIVLPDTACSGQHLKIRIESQEGVEDQFILTDLASSNGTYVGDKANYRDASNRVYRHVLKDGDYLLVGETTLVFKRV